jgi:hypothetical protein
MDAGFRRHDEFRNRLPGGFNARQVIVMPRLLVIPVISA